MGRFRLLASSESIVLQKFADFDGASIPAFNVKRPMSIYVSP